jgi:hypothetical protein
VLQTAPKRFWRVFAAIAVDESMRCVDRLVRMACYAVRRPRLPTGHPAPADGTGPCRQSLVDKPPVPPCAVDAIWRVAAERRLVTTGRWPAADFLSADPGPRLRFLMLRSLEFAPTGQQHDSPGHRPGNPRSTTNLALKGQNKMPEGQTLRLPTHLRIRRRREVRSPRSIDGNRPVSPFQGLESGRPIKTQGVALGCHVVAPTGRRKAMRNFKNVRFGLVKAPTAWTISYAGAQRIFMTSGAAQRAARRLTPLRIV